MSDRSSLTTEEKLHRLQELGRRRETSEWPGYTKIGDYHEGIYESDFVSPYTKSAFNVNASLMILLQDWASDDFLRGPINPAMRDLGHAPTLATNINLVRLLKTHFEMELQDTFASNVFPFAKSGGMGTAIPRKDMVRAAKEFALPQIDIVQPVTVACLGLSAFNSLAIAVGEAAGKNLDEAVRSPFLYGHAEVWCQGHTGALGTMSRQRSGSDQVEKDWAAMAASHRSRLKS